MDFNVSSLIVKIPHCNGKVWNWSKQGFEFAQVQGPFAHGCQSQMNAKVIIKCGETGSTATYDLPPRSMIWMPRFDDFGPHDQMTFSSSKQTWSMATTRFQKQSWKFSKQFLVEWLSSYTQTWSIATTRFQKQSWKFSKLWMKDLLRKRKCWWITSFFLITRYPV